MSSGGPSGSVAIHAARPRDGAGGAILRDIARGGIAGVLTGGLVGGLGGRVVMRAAALAVPDAAGRFTENGNLIGNITLLGSLGLVVFGLFVGLFIGVFWVAVAPWIPGAGVRRALATMPIALAMGGVGLVGGDNSDFHVLHNNLLVVVMLLGLVAAVGFVVALADDLFDRRLPGVAGASPRLTIAYSILAGIGAIFTLPILAGGLFGGDLPRVAMGLALLVTAGATAGWWKGRFEGTALPSARLVHVGRGGLVAIVVFGLIDLLPEVREALRLT